AGTVGTANAGLTGEIEDFGNGWHRCSVTFTTDATDTTGTIRVFLADGESLSITRDGTSSVLVYGAQLEAGSTPSSYMPTSGGTYTRTAQS
ncbi:phage head spike fiber domain-containing protein, partial [Vibrio parahaemolyticus]|uniref:phage head spike fiber domain-containing protein n=1 Tax=Vibrio parahaemolyticus TaxID=670 RepID=UPI002112CAD7